MNKKISYITLALLLVVSVVVLVNCGSKSNDTPAATSTPLPAAIKSNVYLDSILADANYKFLHGSTSPDGTKMMVVVNKSDVPQGVTTGEAVLYMLDATALTQGNVVKLLGPVSIGSNAATPKQVTFRANWTADGTKIMLAGGDRFWVLNAADFTPLNGANGDANLLAGSAGTWAENHDALPTTDGKYALLTIRTKPYSAVTDSTKIDGEIKLYDVTAKTVVGAGVSVCNECHGQTTPKNSILCGIDGKLEKQANGTYTGTVYVAGHGGHIAKAAVTIDPANTTTPVVVSALDRPIISSLKFAAGTAAAAGSVGTSQYKLHDVRIDGTTLYWSTYNTDINSVVHYGTLNLTTSAVVDNTEPIPARAAKPGAGVDKMPIYCASGITPKAHMPMTMTNEAYITVIPR
jgi:hypothetical protein